MSKILKDGTLCVTVDDFQKVKRVLVQDNYNFGGLYYPDNVPTADRPQGEWIDKGDYAICSNCEVKSGTQYDGVEPVPLKTRYCHNCGARMKGADNDSKRD